ncbi:MAG: PDZ domain-containing protein [Planctomycetota bacterium]|nr:PDZ domain-containing protein [Planctomycetota bacterium]
MDVQEHDRDSNAPGCAEVRECLSELLDLRRGEAGIPAEHPLAGKDARARYEAHLEACAACRGALEDLAGVGALFSGFEVGELPAQAFDDYGSRARRRMQEAEGVSPVLRLAAPPSRPNLPAARRHGWLSAAGAMAAAAAMVLLTSVVFGPRALQPRMDEPAVASRGPEAAPEEIRKMLDGARRPIRALGNVALSGLPSGPLMMVDPQTPRRPRTFEPGTLKSPEELMALIARDLERKPFTCLGECSRPANCLLGAVYRVEADADTPAGRPQGVEVWDVHPGSPAYHAGLRHGDLILGINDLKFEDSSPGQVLKLMNGLKALGQGEWVEIDYARRMDAGSLDHGQWSWQRTVVELGKFEP